METVTDTHRFPLISENGRRLIQRLREHPHAPRFSAQSGNRLNADGLQRLRAYEAEVRAEPVGWAAGSTPTWLNDFVTMCYDDVPFYRRYGARPSRFTDIPTADRADLSRESPSFVPDALPIDELIIYTTSGTTGHSIIVPSHPVVAGCYRVLLRAMLTSQGITLQSGEGQVACVLIGYQQNCFTYVSVTPEQAEAAFVKINLHPDDWQHPDDRARYLDDCQPEIITGDPISFAELGKLSLHIRPKALISTSMVLLPGLRQQLEERFDCPVFDIYSTNESGPIGLNTADGYALVQHRLYVEILDAEGRVCPPGVRGEITLSGGFNPYLPLLRYRTGDYASLMFRGSLPILVGLAGRPPTVFWRKDGETINNIDVTHALKSFALPQFKLHQHADGTLLFQMRDAPIAQAQLREALLKLFGADQPLVIEVVASLGDKVIQYTSDMR